MPVRMRLAPHRLTPSSPDKIYRIVTMVNTLSRDRAPLETVGVYDPTPRAVPVVPASRRSLLDEGKQPETSWVKRIEWDRERVQHWLSHGAQPTKRVAWLLQKEKLIPPGKTYHGYSGRVLTAEELKAKEDAKAKRERKAGSEAAKAARPRSSRRDATLPTATSPQAAAPSSA